MSTYSLKKSIIVNAPSDRVYRALTNSVEITKYYPLNSVESTWEVGGEVLYCGDLDGAPFTDYGIIESLEPGRLYAYRYWSNNHDTHRSDENYVIIQYQLESLGDSTRVTVLQSNIKTRYLFEAMDDHVWDYLLSGLKHYVETE